MAEAAVKNDVYTACDMTYYRTADVLSQCFLENIGFRLTHSEWYSVCCFSKVHKSLFLFKAILTFYLGRQLVKTRLLKNEIQCGNISMSFPTVLFCGMWNGILLFFCPIKIFTLRKQEVIKRMARNNLHHNTYKNWDRFVVK